ncbi:MAG: leucine-rich repeat domain-containing protein [Oscillospiraceae bacterium]|nr:leucine-rich repeat domain-containing protein [Oscillospiraceae bacterium]
MKKRTLALLLALVFSLSLLPVGVLAEETTDDEAEETVMVVSEDSSTTDYTVNCTLTCDGEMVTETTTANYFDEDVQHTIFYMEMEVGESCALGLSGADTVSLSTYSGDGAVSISDTIVTAESAGYGIISLLVDETAATYIYINVTDSSAYPTSGSCGDGLSWTLEEGVLTISGTGAMDDYLTYYSGLDENNVVYTPWYDSRDNITAVVIEDGVTSIGAGAFFYCTNLTRVTIPSSVASIGNDAFADCQGLPSISIPASVTSIGSYAFAWCTSLTSITIPAGITSIENGTFFYCSSLTRVTFSGNAPSFGEYDVFLDVTATVYYPANNNTWTEDIMLDYGGDITWRGAAEPVIGPVTGELDDILLSVGWYTFSNYFDLGEDAWERLIYRTVDDYIFYEAQSSFDSYLVDVSNEYAGYEIPYDLFMEQVDAMFVTHSDMKDFLTRLGAYDAASDTVTVEYYGGEGDTWTWDAFTTYEDEDYIYVQGVYSSGIAEAGDFTLTDDMVENIDYYIRSYGSHGELTTPIELVLVRSGEGYKIAAFREVSFYIIDNVLYNRVEQDDGTTATDIYYPLTVNISTTADGVETALNSTLSFSQGTVTSEDSLVTVAFDSGMNYYLNGAAWRAENGAVTFDVAVPEGYTVTVTYSDDSETDKAVTEYSSGGYEILPDGGLTIHVTIEAETETVETPAPTNPPAEETTKIETNALTEVPEGLSDIYASTEALTDDLVALVTAETSYTEENVVVFDVVLQISTDGGITWTDATEEDFPVEGITVTLPYPDETDSSYDFVVAHMFTITSERLGTVAGEVEYPAVTKTANGIQVTLKGLSPVAIAWTEGAAATATPTATAATAAPAVTAPNTGDEMNAALWLTLAFLCAAGLTVTVVARKKKG